MAQTSNPYQSPMQAELPADEPLRAVDFSGRYSLQEGLAIAVAVEPLRDKLWRWSRLARSFLPFAFIPFVVNGVTTLAIETQPGELVFGIVVLVGIAAGALLTGREISRERREWKQPFARQDEQSAGIFQPFGGSVSHAGLAVERAGVKTQRPWSLYTHYQQRQDVILFWLKDKHEADAISRSQFESGEDWLRAVRMAEHHLPKRPGGTISNS